jgi:hypothetical protein
MAARRDARVITRDLREAGHGQDAYSELSI